MQNEEWNVSAVSLSPELVRLAQQKQARFEACRQAAENGNEAAITELGINYFYGTNGVPEDPDAAFYWLSRTSPENAAGRCFLGACYVIGKGTKQDERTAAELFRDSAALGFPPAQYELGLCYEHGIGLERNMARAVELYALAAEQEDAQAQCALGNLYFTGNLEILNHKELPLGRRALPTDSKGSCFIRRALLPRHESPATSPDPAWH